MNSTIVTKLLKKGVGPQVPRFLARVTDLQKERDYEQAKRCKCSVLIGFEKSAEYRKPEELRKFFATQGKTFQQGDPHVVEMWRNAAEERIAFLTQTWKVYRVQRTANILRITSRIC